METENLPNVRLSIMEKTLIPIRMSMMESLSYAIS